MFSFVIVFFILFFSYKLAINKIVYSQAKNNTTSKSLHSYYGMCLVIWNSVSILIVYLAKSTFDIYIDLTFLFFISIILVSTIGFILLNENFKAREHFEKFIYSFLLICTFFTVMVTVLIIFVIFFQANKFFSEVPFWNFISGTVWNPQNEIADQIIHSFGAIPVFTGTFLITIISIIIAAPLGIFSATYLSEYASKKTRMRIKPLIEILAGIPTVVYGYFAVMTVAPFIREIGISLNLNISSESAITAGIVIGIMIIPYILSLTDDAINSIPSTLRDASLALGATKAETITKIILPAARTGIFSALLLAISRAIGETMIVTMAAGLNAIFTINPFASVTTVTAQIVSLLTGDQEFDSVKTLAAFTLALTLFVITFILNIIAQLINKKYHYKYG